MFTVSSYMVQASPKFHASNYCVRSNENCGQIAERDYKPAHDFASASFTWLDILRSIPSRSSKMVPFHLTVFYIAQLPYSRSSTRRPKGDNVRPFANPRVIDYKDVVTGTKHCAAPYVHACFLYTHVKWLLTRGSPAGFDNRKLWPWNPGFRALFRIMVVSYED